MKKILVTGTAGFIGFHTAKKLLEDGYVVIGIDTINDYYDITMKIKRNEFLKKFSNYIFKNIDISNFEELNQLVQKEKPDKIIHLAAQAGVRYSLINPWAYEKANGLGTLNIFETARKNGIKRVIFASSSSVYGKNSEIPFKENNKTDTPISLYAASKKYNEMLAHAYNHLYGIETAGLRFFTVYGTFGRPDLALFKFVKNILLDKSIDVYNQGNMKRGFTYIGDVVTGIIAAMNKEDLSYEIYNLGGEKSIELLKFIELIEQAVGKKARLNLLPMQPGDVKETYADISKASEDLGYCPETPIEEGIKFFVDWFVENKDWLLVLEDGKQ